MKRRWLTLLIAIAIVLCIGWRCDDDEYEPSDDSEPVYKIFEFELDQQAGMDPFYPWGHWTINGFLEGTAFIQFYEDSMSLAPESVLVIDAAAYHSRKAQKEFAGMAFEYPYYLCGITHFFGWYYSEDLQENVPANWLLGLTAPFSNDEVRWSFTCVQNTMAYDHSDATIATTTHELGHNIAFLTHYCLDSEYVDFTNHDQSDGACVMAFGGDTVRCTGQSSYSYIHFCDSCIARLARVAILD